MKILHEQGTLKVIPVTKIHPNPWNPNVQNETEFEAVLSGLKTYGQVAPLVCRNHPTKDGHFEVVDGEHRLRAIKETQTESCDVYDLGIISDTRAKKLTIMLSEARGSNDAIKLGMVLDDLMKQLDEDELLAGLPQDLGEVQDLIDIANHDWESELDSVVSKEDFGHTTETTGTAQPIPSNTPKEEEGETVPNEEDPQVYTFGPYYLHREDGKKVQALFDEVKEFNPGISDAEVFLKLMLE